MTWVCKYAFVHTNFDIWRNLCRRSLLRYIIIVVKEKSLILDSSKGVGKLSKKRDNDQICDDFLQFFGYRRICLIQFSILPQTAINRIDLRKCIPHFRRIINQLFDDQYRHTPYKIRYSKIWKSMIFFLLVNMRRGWFFSLLKNAYS